MRPFLFSLNQDLLNTRLNSRCTGGLNDRRESYDDYIVSDDVKKLRESWS